VTYVATHLFLIATARQIADAHSRPPELRHELRQTPVQRCRRAQYVGFPTAVTLSGSKFVGLVQSVKQEVGPRWIVTNLRAPAV
jgi:hypothetical protein